jgi:CRP-like cAMP-binding protein
MTGLPDTTIGLQGLRACRLFAGVDDVQLGVLAGSMRSRRYRDGETIFHQDDPADALYVVADGAVKIVLPSAEDAEPAILATLGPGDFFGALALLDEAPRSATAIALGKTQALMLRRDAFLALIDADRTLRRALLASLAFEIRSLTAHVHDLHFLDLPARLISRILREADGAVTGPSGAVTVRWPYTQAELAGMIGGSRQSVNRLLSDLAAAGLVQPGRGALVIPDPAALQRSIRR